MLSQLHLISALGPGILIFQVSFGILLVAAVAHVGEVALDEVVADEEVTAPAVGR